MVSRCESKSEGEYPSDTPKTSTGSEGSNLPERLKDALIHHMDSVRSQFDEDRRKNINGVALPGALERQYPNAGREWGWFCRRSKPARCLDVRKEKSLD